jgi:hypothetical protein
MITLFITNRDGQEIGFEDFDDLDELFHRWPYAEKEDEVTYNSWIGAKR